MKPKFSIEGDFLGTWRIGEHDYSVVLVPKLYDGAEGAHDSDTCTIFVTPGTKDQVEDRIVHEALHALLERFGIEYFLCTKGVDVEDLVRRLVPALRATFKFKLPIMEKPRAK